MPRPIRSFSQNHPHAVDTSRGTDQSGVKLYNERLVLSLIRSHGRLSKTEIARRTGLSTQTSSVIMKHLERDGLLVREEPMRGKVGQPSIPMSLNPEGAFSIGFKFGRRSATFVLMDLVGNVRRLQRTTYAYPVPDELGAVRPRRAGRDHRASERSTIRQPGSAVSESRCLFKCGVGRPKSEHRTKW